MNEKEILFAQAYCDELLGYAERLGWGQMHYGKEFIRDRYGELTRLAIRAQRKIENQLDGRPEK